MKKQILFLAIFSLAVLAGTNNAWGQALTTSGFGTAPNPLVNCVGDAQHPRAGVSYTYDFAASSATIYTWWATKDPDFISSVPTLSNQATDSLKVSNGELLDVSLSYWDSTATASVDITWSADILSRTSYQQGDVGYPGTVAAPTSTFVVGYGTDGCTDNIKVWEIDPSPAFTVDIKNIDDATRQPTVAYGDPVSQCVDEVRAAKYNNTSFDIDYNYGWDTLYYEVVAANFATSWIPTFFMTGLDGGGIQTAEIGWSETWADAQAGNFVEAAAIDITAGTATGTVPLTTTLLDNSGGVSLYVRVVIENNNYETLAASTIELSVAGEDAVGFDIDDDATCTVPATAADAADDDETTRTITPRPTLVEGEPIILINGGTTTP
ncbi:MAG: hypothetical protein AB7S72_08910 [Draconibacterium sp.]